MPPFDLATVFHASPNCYMVLDRDLRYVAANEAYLKATGSTFEAIQGRCIFDLFPNDPEDPNNEPRRLLEASFRKVLATKQRDVLAVIPYRVARRPGAEPTLRIWSATHVPLFDANGEVAFILQHTEDVTELRRDDSRAANVLSRAATVQQSLNETGERLRGVVSSLDQAPGFMAFLRGPDHVFELANRAYLRLVGNRELLGKTVRDALPELADQAYFELLDQVYTSKRPFVGTGMRVELLTQEREAEESYVDFVYQPILDESGTCYGVLVQGQDVTHLVRNTVRDRFRTRASELLAAAGDDLEPALIHVARAAVETLADFATLDLFDGEVSRRLVAAHADPDLVEKEQILLRYPVRYRDVMRTEPREVLRPRAYPSVTEEELRFVAHDQTHLDVLARLGIVSFLVVPIGYRDKLFGVLTLGSTERTRRRFAERDVQSMAELGQVIGAAFDNARLARERQALLTSTEEARRRAEAASRAKDDFLAVLGHELRNPLSPIVSAVELIRSEQRPAGDRELAIIERQARHLVRLVDDMLDVSRIVRGKLELRRAPVSLSPILKQAIEIVMPAFEKKQHRVAFETLSEDVWIDGDEARLAQVFVNLLANAARYTPQGGKVSLSARTERSQAVVEISDDGVGIEPEMLPRVFDSFAQAPQPSDRSEGGLGLGLTLVKQLVELHGGSVAGASAGVGKGSEWTVRLPVLEGTRAGDVRAVGRKQTPTQGFRIVVVDDNEDAAEMLALLLRARGHAPTVAHEGHAALELLVHDPPEVAIIDIGLPGLDGFELAARARRDLGERTPKLIALTGYGSEQDRERSARAGFDAHLTKPVDTKTLMRVIRELGTAASPPG